MTKMDKPIAFSRRAVLKGGGALVVSVGMPIGLDTLLGDQLGARAGHASPPLMPDQLSSYIAINADGTVSAFFGKMDMGQGLLRRDRPDGGGRARRAVQGRQGAHGRHRTSVNQGGASGSTGIQIGGKQMRVAAAEARRVLVEMAAREARHAGRPAHRRPTASCSAEVDPRQEGDLCRADRRPLLQRPARLEQADRQRALCARQGASRRSRANTRSSASRSSATTSRRRCSARRPSSPTSRCRAWCMPA